MKKSIPSHIFAMDDIQTENIIAPLIIFIFSVIYLKWVQNRKWIMALRARREVEKYLKEYEPEPLCSDNEDYRSDYHVIGGRAAVRLRIKEKDYLNLASYNFLNILGKRHIEAKAIKTIQKYGVGSCGPRGFYGTVDVHLNLEERIAAFMNMEEAVVYAYGFSTIASAIPAYCKQQDVIFCDDKISFPARRGMVAAKSKIIYFAHNDVNDLEAKINEHIDGNFINLHERKFLILEGIYVETGVICDLPNMVQIRSKYKMRLFLDESFSIGVLGTTGRGILEHYNIHPSEVDLVIGSLETLIGSIGGFCVGTHFTIEHQRLSGLGYCFSASLPPVLTFAAMAAFDYLDENRSDLFNKIRIRSKTMHSLLNQLSYMEPSGDEQSPIKYLKFISTTPPITRKHYKMFADMCRKSGLLVVLCPNKKVEVIQDLECRIKLCVNIALADEEMRAAYEVLSDVSATIVEDICSSESDSSSCSD